MIKLNNVSKYFKTESNKKYILKNVTIEIPSNVNIGILGRNGAGKSTLLRMLGGIDFPTSGTIKSKNTFSWPMGLSGGFQGSMTGRQNVKFVCRIYGKKSFEIEEIILSVQEFAEIGDYFDMPIKLYSSGMKGRLSFGLSLAFDFDYLIIDETLSVGDENFKKKATAALEKKIQNCNVLLVSHAMGTLRKICDAGIVVNDGELFYYDNVDDAIKAYHDINNVLPLEKKDKTNSKTIYCNDGKVFRDITDAAQFYKMRPFSIIQALNENNGTHIFLKKIFWKEGNQQQVYQEWSQVGVKKTIISSDGIIFDDTLELTDFYQDRMPNVNFNSEYIEEVMKNQQGKSEKLRITFYYLSEYQ